MLISFTLENWMSFAEEATLTLVPSRERNHKERISVIPEYKLRLSPIAAIYGANASGKSNFIKALKFCTDFVAEPPAKGKRIKKFSNKLLNSCADKPTRFCFEFYAEGTCYEYEFQIFDGSVISERLVKILKTTEKVLYSRVGQEFVFSKELAKNERLSFVAEGTRSNVLFLSNSIDQQLTVFESVYYWFHRLLIITPQSKMQLSKLLEEDACDFDLSRFDTGISRFETKDVSEKYSVVSGLSELFEKQDKDHVSLRIGGNDLQIAKDGDSYSFQTVVSVHENDSGEDVEFDLSEESDGTNRLLHLYPALAELCSGPTDSKILIIDELDRSFHSILTRTFIRSFIETCSPESRNQLIFSTHDLLVMDQELLRRDEMWITEKNREGNSSLYSLADFKEVRKDKDVRKSYLQGRFGGIPRVIHSVARSAECSNA